MVEDRHQQQRHRSAQRQKGPQEKSSWTDRQMNPLSFSGPLSEARLRVLSLGAGVQSTTIALMAAHGEITPMPDCAIFADTGAEPAQVYDHFRWLTGPNVLPFPVYTVS